MRGQNGSSEDETEVGEGAPPVIVLDWSGVDSGSNPLHPASKLFDSRSSTKLHYIYILYLEKLSINIVL